MAANLGEAPYYTDATGRRLPAIGTFAVGADGVAPAGPANGAPVNDSTLGPYRFGAASSSLAAGASTPGVYFPRGGNYRWQVLATGFGGGTLSMEGLGPDGATWLPFSPVAALTANGGMNVGIPEGLTVRLTNTGGTGITGLNATAAIVR